MAGLLRKIITILVFFCISHGISGQNAELDSLWNVFKSCKHDSSRIKMYFEIGYIYEYIIPDSALSIYKKAVALADKNIGKNPYNKSEITKKFARFKGKSIMYMGIVVMDQGNYTLAMEYYNKAKDIFLELDDIRGVSNCYTNIGIIYGELGKLQNSLEAYFKSQAELEKIGDKVGIARNYNNIGIIYSDMGNYDKALEFYLKSLKIKEELGDKRGIAQSYNNIGILHKDHGNNEKSIEYYQKSLDLSEEIGDYLSASDALNNLGNVYSDLGTIAKKKGNENESDKNYEKSIEYFLKALKIRNELSDIKGIAHSYGNLANIYVLQGKYKTALEYHTKSLNALIEIDDKSGIASTYGNLAYLYTMVADEAKNETDKKNNLTRSIYYGEMGFELADTIGALPLKRTISQILMVSYKKTGKLKEALDFAEIFIEINDSIFNQDKTRALADAEKKFEAEKKQLEIEKLSKEKALQNSEILREKEKSQRQKIVIIFIIVGLILVIVFTIFVIQRLRITRKQKRIIEEQKQVVDETNIILNQQNDEIRAQRDEISAQRDLVTKQKERIEGQKKEITDSITYAQQIQQAMLPDLGVLLGNNTHEEITQLSSQHPLINDYFVLYKPKDIVSGDFYWSTRINEMLILTVADCTGHGVPGAFMSMLGISYLNEIVRKKEVTKASEVLNQLRSSVIEALKQKGVMGEQKDGMDIVFCAINTETMVLQYAGANNPLYIVPGSGFRVPDEVDPKHETRNSELIEIKADPQPVAIHVEMKPFTNHEIQLNKGDCIYLASDGFQDQFGGEKGKKFMLKRFKEMLLANSEMTMKDQKENLESTFEEWKGGYKQIDDVTIIGIRI